MKISLKFGTPFGRRSWKKWHVFDTLARQLEKLARLWHVGMFTGTLARKNEKLPRFWHVGRYGTHDTQFSQREKLSSFGIWLLFSIMKRKAGAEDGRQFIFLSQSKELSTFLIFRDFLITYEEKEDGLQSRIVQLHSHQFGII